MFTKVVVIVVTIWTQGHGALTQASFAHSYDECQTLGESLHDKLMHTDGVLGVVTNCLELDLPHEASN